jgi:dethiobiotin synthetase
MGLGTINHTLLTLREADRRGLRVLGVVLNGWDSTGKPLSDADERNLQELRGRLAVPVIAELRALDLGPSAGWTRERLAPIARCFQGLEGLVATLSPRGSVHGARG